MLVVVVMAHWSRLNLSRSPNLQSLLLVWFLGPQHNWPDDGRRGPCTTGGDKRCSPLLLMLPLRLHLHLHFSFHVQLHFHLGIHPRTSIPLISLFPNSTLIYTTISTSIPGQRFLPTVKLRCNPVAVSSIHPGSSLSSSWEKKASCCLPVYEPFV